MKIKQVVCCPGRTGFYFDDQLAIRKGAKADGIRYIGEAVTEGFTSVRQAGESICVMFILEDGQIAYGDCAAVQYSGAGGRDPLFLAEQYIPLIEGEIANIFVGQELDSFRRLCELIENPSNGKTYHTAIRYGISQAILDAVAKNEKKTMAEIIAQEYHCKVKTEMIPIFTQSGDARYDNADKMIIKQSPVLPHGLFNHVAEKLGEQGEKLLAYITWLKNRIEDLRTSEVYQPIIHLDVYGTIGFAFDFDDEKIIRYLSECAKAAAPFTLYIEGVVDLGDRTKQMEALRDIRMLLEERQIPVWLVADEWCNTLSDVKYFVDNKAGHIIQIKTPDLGSISNTAEAVLYCKKNQMGAYQGGTCNETDQSAKTCVQVAMGVGADQILAKPGMGVDEGFMIVYNEMQRILRLTRK